MGTSVGTKVFVDHGWRAAAALNLAFLGFQFTMLLLRGPHCSRYTWFGYEGGLEARKSVVDARKESDGGATSPPDSSGPSKDVEEGKDEKLRRDDEKQSAESGSSQ